MKIRVLHTKIYGMQPKQCLKGNLFKHLYFKKGRSRATDLTSPQDTLDKENETHPSRRMETLEIRTEIRGTDKRKALEKISKTRNWLPEKMNKTDKALA